MSVFKNQSKFTTEYRDAGGGGAGGACAPPQVLGYQLTLFRPRVADYARHITTGHPIFLDDAASLNSLLVPSPTFTFWPLQSFNFKKFMKQNYVFKT